VRIGKRKKEDLMLLIRTQGDKGGAEEKPNLVVKKMGLEVEKTWTTCTTQKRSDGHLREGNWS